MPIYWLGGTKVVDDYEDFYDGRLGRRDQPQERVPEFSPAPTRKTCTAAFSGSYHGRGCQNVAKTMNWVAATDT